MKLLSFPGGEEPPGAFKYAGTGCGRSDLTEGKFTVDSTVSKKCR